MNTKLLSAAAIDVGYGNLKVMAAQLGGDVDTADSLLLPIGAAPIEQAPRLANGAPQLHGGEEVLLPDGRRWVGGIDPTFLSGFARQTHDDYPSTDEYLALYLAGLAKLEALGHRTIDVLVTGVPCSQFVGPRRQELKDTISRRFRGVHQLGGNRTVEVRNAFVVAQPMGCYTGFLREHPIQLKPGERDTRTVLVIDPGFYSVDWVLMQSGAMREGSAGSSHMATSTILEAAAQAISSAHGGVPLSVAKLDGSFRNGDEILRLGALTVQFRGFIEAAAAEKARVAMSKIASAMRLSEDVVDYVLLCGGAALLFQSAAKKAFPASEVLISPNPVMANVRGYLGMALRYPQVQRKAG
ncbi:MAG: hypothetical protein BGO50_01595 [Rhodanobacter sp. 67-28]|nr:MAG: hypothetical protein BGO50_01595 [Rhodanobacter sp. 67-28]